VTAPLGFGESGVFNGSRSRHCAVHREGLRRGLLTDFEFNFAPTASSGGEFVARPKWSMAAKRSERARGGKALPPLGRGSYDATMHVSRLGDQQPFTTKDGSTIRSLLDRTNAPFRGAHTPSRAVSGALARQREIPGKSGWPKMIDRRGSFRVWHSSPKLHDRN